MNNLYTAVVLPATPVNMLSCDDPLFILYQEQFDDNLHINAVTEMLRVCRAGGQIRIYPVYDFKGLPYSHLEGIKLQMQEQGATVELIASELPFIPGSTHYLSIQKP